MAQLRCCDARVMVRAMSSIVELMMQNEVGLPSNGIGRRGHQLWMRKTKPRFLGLCAFPWVYQQRTYLGNIAGIIANFNVCQGNL